MVFEIKFKDLGGRVAKLETKHGVIETPLLLPVINPFKKGVDVRDIVNAGFNALITNSYFIWKRYREEPPNVHELLGFDGPVMTDSGAYQILQYGDVEVDPEEIVEFQRVIGSDIAVILDIPTPIDADRDGALRGVLETVRRAEMLKRREGDPLWVGPIQGGRYLDLVEFSARRMSKLNFDIYAIGSPTGLMESYDFATVLRMVLTAKRVLGPEKPIHLFGAGHPMFISFMVAAGVDLADSASYALYAVEDRYMTSHGTYRIEELYNLPCSCPICSRYTAEELKELHGYERFRLIALHNLYVLAGEIRRVKQAIVEGSLWELLEERSRTHPALLEAFKVLKEWLPFIERYDPLRGPTIQGIFFYNDPKRPETIRHVKRLIERFPIWPSTSHLIFLPAPFEKPYSASSVSGYLKELLDRLGLTDKTQIFFIGGPFSVVPLELSECYPLSQHEGYVTDFKVVVKTLKKLFKRAGSRRVILVYTRSLRGFVSRLGVKARLIEINNFDSDDKFLETLKKMEPVLIEALVD